MRGGSGELSGDAKKQQKRLQRKTVLPAAVRFDMVLHQAFHARRVRKTGIGGEVRHGVTSGVSCETSKT